MNTQRIRYTQALLLAAVVAPVALFAADAATRPADAGPTRTMSGKLTAIDAAGGDLTLAWKHGKASAMELALKLDPKAEVQIDGKPARIADLKVGDTITVTGQAEGTGPDNKFVVRKIQSGAVATAAPSSAPAGVDPMVNHILDRLERRGDQIKDIETPIKFTKLDLVLEDKQVFEGILRFKQDKPNPRFFIRFDKFTQEGITRDKKEWHIFDGQWYIEARENTSTIVKRQIVRPGEEVNVFRIGQGPFPLPFGQKKAEILNYFDVKMLPPVAKDPPNTLHLECIPKSGTDMADKYGSVHFYIDPKLDLPVSVRTVEKGENNEVSAEFPADKIRLNTGMAGSELNLPDLPYQIDTVPLPAPAPAAAQ